MGIKAKDQSVLKEDGPEWNFSRAAVDFLILFGRTRSAERTCGGGNALSPGVRHAVHSNGGGLLHAYERGPVDPEVQGDAPA